MPLDHYVSQVHLRRFYSPALGELMYAIRKTDLRHFTPNSQSVCRIADGSTNAYLREDRVIEEFLKTIEPNYISTIEKLANNKIDKICIYTISGFVSYIITCSPGGMRILTDPIKSTVEITAALMDEAGLTPPPPPELAGTSLSELLRSGAVEVEVDPKFPQAISISSILQYTATLGNFDWEILRNGTADSPFFTSDYPAAIEETNDPRILNRIIPLTSDLAIRIKPNLARGGKEANFSFENFTCSFRDIRRAEVLEINRRIVRCAEDLVFYRDDRPWVRSFVEKHREYRIEPVVQEFSTSTGTVLVSTQRIKKKTT